MHGLGDDGGDGIDFGGDGFDFGTGYDPSTIDPSLGVDIPQIPILSLPNSIGGEFGATAPLDTNSTFSAASTQTQSNNPLTQLLQAFSTAAQGVAKGLTASNAPSGASAAQLAAAQAASTNMLTSLIPLVVVGLLAVFILSQSGGRR